MKIIPLTAGYVAWIDDEDFEAVKQVPGRHWQVTIRGRRAYAVRRVVPYRQAPGSGQWERMHRIILAAGDGQHVDHREHRADKVVDNRRRNLRLATSSQNNINRLAKVSAASCFKGVFRGEGGRWRAATRKDNVRLNLGTFRDEGHAALAYDLAVVRLHGEFAVTNFPIEGSTKWLFGEGA